MYGVHPAVAHAKAIISNLPRTTGAPVEVWISRVQEADLGDRKAIVGWLRSKHGVGGTTANVITKVILEGYASIDDAAYLAAAPGYVDALYSGPRETLRALHDAVAELCMALGPDVRLCPVTTMVSVYRNHVIAQIRPTTRTRIDLGLSLEAGSEDPRLIDTGGASRGDRITYRIALHALDAVDGSVDRWLRSAYERDAMS